MISCLEIIFIMFCLCLIIGGGLMAVMVVGGGILACIAHIITTIAGWFVPKYRP